MSVLSIRLLTAPRLERDVYRYYLRRYYFRYEDVYRARHRQTIGKYDAVYDLLAAALARN